MMLNTFIYDNSFIAIVYKIGVIPHIIDGINIGNRQFKPDIDFYILIVFKSKKTNDRSQ